MFLGAIRVGLQKYVPWDWYIYSGACILHILLINSQASNHIAFSYSLLNSSTGEVAFSLLIYCCSFLYYVINKLPVLCLVSIITQLSFSVNFSLIVFIDFFCDVYMTFFKAFLKIYYHPKTNKYATLLLAL